MQNDLNSFIERCQRLTMGLWTNFGRLYGTGSGGFGPFEYHSSGIRIPRSTSLEAGLCETTLEWTYAAENVTNH